MRKRDAKYEFIRVFSMILVVGVHSFSACSLTYMEESLAGRMVSTFLLLCNGLFFMISGRFALSTCCQTGSDFRKYYLKRIGSIGIPVLVGMLFRSMFNIGCWIPEYFLSREFLKEYVQNVLYNFSACEYWFLYELAGFLVAAPFVGKLLQQATRTELAWLLGIGICWNAATTYLPRMGFSFAWEFPLGGWFVLFVLGYAAERILHTKQEENLLMLLGGISFVVSIVLQENGWGAGANGMSPTYAITTAAVFTALKRLYRPGKFVDAVVIHIGALTMPVYLLHMMVLYTVQPHIPQWSVFPRAIILQLVTLGLTLILGFILDRTVLSGLQWLYRKLTGLQGEKTRQDVGISA